VRFFDVVRLSLSALRLHRLRTVLTTLGVTFGSFVLFASLSIQQGVPATISREYSRFGDLRQIDVYPVFSSKVKVPAEKLKVEGTMSAARRQRLQQAIRRDWEEHHAPESGIRLTKERLRDLAALEHVRSVEPVNQQYGRVILKDRMEYVHTLAARPDDKYFHNRLVAGTSFSSSSAAEVLVTELCLYRLSIVDDVEVEEVLGKKLRLEFRGWGRPKSSNLLAILQGGEAKVTASEEQLLDKVLQRLPGVFETLDLKLQPLEKKLLKKLLQKPPTPSETKPEVVVARDFTIRGVLRGAEESETQQRRDWMYRSVDVVLPSQTAEELFYEMPQQRESGFNQVVVEVDDVDHVKDVHQKILEMGLRPYSRIDIIEKEQLVFGLIFSVMVVVALVGLIVAALGMLNTMLMSVLERFREIGIMKAVGGRNRDIKIMFLMEGALIGLMGGLVGMLLAWLFALVADEWVRSMVASRWSVQLQESVFVFPLWLVLGVPIFACLMTTLAAYYPARRAVRVNPVAALRHE
jgi:putative ABC transport system permease protein